MNTNDELILSRDEVRAVDAFAIHQLGIHGTVLMENAGRGCVDSLLQFSEVSAALIVCGGGNNGGDGYVIARHLSLRNIRCRILSLVDPDRLPSDARSNAMWMKKLKSVDWIDASKGLDEETWDAAFATVSDRSIDWIVDAMLGTGAKGSVREPYRSVVERINQWHGSKMAVDIPTGLDCDDGTVTDIALRADLTCTFVARKPGLLTDEGRRYTGAIDCLDIGLPREWVEQALQWRHQQ